MKKIGLILSILTVLTLSFITNNNVSAASDLTYTINSSNCTTSHLIYDNSSDPYTYLYITPTSDSYNGLYSAISLRDNSNFRIYPTNSFTTYYIGSFDYVNYMGTGNICNNYFPIYPSDSFSITLTNTNPFGGVTPEGTLDVVSNGTYDVTNYASVDVQVVESSFIVQLFSQGFWGVATAIVSIIVPIIALFLVFRLVHDLLWGRG